VPSAEVIEIGFGVAFLAGELVRSCGIPGGLITVGQEIKAVENALQFPARGGVSPFHPVRSTAKNPQPCNRTPGGQERQPTRAGFTTLPGQQSAAG
jgi:hypothetical protein